MALDDLYIIGYIYSEMRHVTMQTQKAIFFAPLLNTLKKNLKVEYKSCLCVIYSVNPLRERCNDYQPKAMSFSNGVNEGF